MTAPPRADFPNVVAPRRFRPGDAPARADWLNKADSFGPAATMGKDQIQVELPARAANLGQHPGNPAYRRHRRPVAIPIALAAPRCPTSRDFVPWPIADADCCWVVQVSPWPASAILHK